MRRIAILKLFLLYCAIARGEACWEEAAQRYRISAQLLYAIARVESGANPAAINRTHRARTGSYDIGLMQINSSHLRGLARHGIREHDLFDACTNIHVGAWLLADSVARHGPTWDAIGAYNASCTQLKGTACQKARAKYAWRVYEELSSLEGTSTALSTEPRPSIRPESPRLILSARVSQ